MGLLEDKVVFITGGARGLGRSHAVQCAAEGADVILFDLCASVETAQHSMGTTADLEETVRLVEAQGRQAVAAQGDVRDFEAVQAAVDRGVEVCGRLDVVIANAGIFAFGLVHELTESEWNDVIGVGLTGSWHALKATIPILIEQEEGGSIILTSSTAGTKGFAGVSNYVAAKHGIIGLAKSAALELGEHNIRVNTIGPTTTATEMALTDAMFRLFSPGLDDPTIEDAKEGFRALNLLPTPWIEPEDVSAAVIYLASDKARFVTGIHLPIDAGAVIK
jgi:SDR family mycofactocin-dependent oxidoreductase